jgi:hypothetical protein
MTGKETARALWILSCAWMVNLNMSQMKMKEFCDFPAFADCQTRLG